MRNTQKLFAVALALVMLLVLSLGVLADYPAETRTELAADYSGKTVILHSNDVHGALEGYAAIAQLKTDLKAKGAEVILADAGDFSQGTPYVSISKGATAVEMMNAVGYDISTVGNHEFDYGYDQLMANLDQAQFQVICANILKDGQAPFAPYAVIETAAGLKLGFFGLDTPEAQTKVNPALIAGMEVLNNSAGKTDLSDCAAAQVEALKAAGADLVIGLTHLGVDDESAPDGHRSLDLLAKLSGVDLLIDGHSHTVMTGGEDGESIQSTGTKFENIGVVVIDNATKQIEEHFLVPVEGLAQDETVLAAARAIIDAVDAEYDVVFARSEVELNGARAPQGNRDSQTNNGNLITEAMLWSVLQAGALNVPEENAVAITNGGGIRAAIAVGDVTMKDVNTVLPFGNTVAVVYVTGAELLEALEASTYSLPIGGYPQTTGIQWTLNTTKVYDANPDTYPGSSYYGPASIQRVSIQSINGKAFDPEATYAVVTNNFCAAGGDTYYAFVAAAAQFDTGIPMDEALVDYIKTELNGVIGETYAAPRGDLREITIENTVCVQSTHNLSIDGEPKEAEMYNINDENYFKLRDVAALLRGTEA
ncbi:MAG: 5'-nucleotidase C-terminal domain-containing protein, partial [Oscillospiraceae bacterium]|nr:5'-nucleotidase C-terminal domain-containing protein [Oscillospiraceae bacterium]